MTEKTLASTAAEKIRSAGLAADLLNETSDRQSFGNAQATFRLGPLLLRFVRDRGEEFLDIASDAAADRFHLFDDVEIAMGWKSTDEVLAKNQPEPLEDVLKRIKTRLDELQKAFSGNQERFTRAKVERAAKERGEAFVRRLQRKPP